MPYFQPLLTSPTMPPPRSIARPPKQDLPQNPDIGTLPLPIPGQTLPMPSGLDPTQADDFSAYAVGGVWFAPGDDHVLNESPHPVVTLHVLNVGDRAIQIGSHIHLADVNGKLWFYDTNRAKEFDDFLANNPDHTPQEWLEAAESLKLDPSQPPLRGYRLDIPAGYSVRFNPEHSPSDSIRAVRIGGNRRVPGLRKGKTAAEADLGQ
ncbi:urease subunit beta [Nocardiopsis alba]|uniref:urease subunit beta n=1 Tax=Nocardiopsis alba TaxID=53437 RepID=UPI00366039A2